MASIVLLASRERDGRIFLLIQFLLYERSLFVESSDHLRPEATTTLLISSLVVERIGLIRFPSLRLIPAQAQKGEEESIRIRRVSD